MKKKNNKKVLSVFAVLAVSATMAMTAIPFAACNKSVNTPKPVTAAQAGPKSVAISTALGTTYSVETDKKIWVSEDVEYSKGSGTVSDPYNFVALLNSYTDRVEPGDTILVKPGVHKMGNNRIKTELSGTFDKYITIRVATHEDDESITDGKATLDFSAMTFDSTNRGVQLDGDFIYWYGIDICGAGDNGMYVGGDFNTIEYCEFYNNRDTGLQLGRSLGNYDSVESWPSYNLVKNCTSHNNYDNESYGENADGFAAKLTVGYGNVFDGCIAYRNSDDGWDLFAKVDSGDIGTVILYNCVAFDNGFIECTRDQYNALFPTYDDSKYDDPSTSEYMTRDGDGNGFKLGGSTMEGDVVMYNCLAFQNRMHGVTDNSNPGYIKLTGITSYDNSAMVDADGKIAAVTQKDNHGNIDVSRQTYSYNTVNNSLSVSNFALTLGSDAYRGSVANSLLNAKTKTNIVKGSIEADTKNKGGLTFTSQADPLVPATMFKQLPTVLEGTEYSYNLQSKDNAFNFGESGITSLKESRVHIAYRNEDGSINMHDMLAKSEAAEALIQQYLGETLKKGESIGAELNYASWDKYVHPYALDFVSGDSQANAFVARTKEALLLNTDEAAVYQDFEVPVKMWNTKITWESSNESLVKVTDEVTVSNSGSQFTELIVTRPYDEDKQVTLTATIKYDTAETTKEFTLTIKKGDPSLGKINVLTQKGELVYDGESIIIDQYVKYYEPQVQVLNGLYPDAEKLLDSNIYTYTTTYKYAANKNAPFSSVNAFSPSKAGVYVITNNITLGGDGAHKNEKGSISYTIYVASPTAKVDLNNAVVSVNRDGYNISGDLTSATGYIYSVSSATALEDITKENIATYNGVKSYEFRSHGVNYNFDNANSGSYYVYYALANLNGDITSAGDNDSGIYCAQVNTVDISTTDDFVTLVKTGKIGEENAALTIYSLKEDLDFTGVSFTVGSASFSGVLNGNGHTISNLTTTSRGIFYKVTGGTIMNVKFNNISLGTGEKVGIVIESTGGYFHNIAITNINAGDSSNGARVAALIGHIGGSSDGSTTVYDTYITQVSVVNDADHKLQSSNRTGGLIGYVQYYYSNIVIDNCYVNADLWAPGKGEAAGMVASWSDDGATDTLTITNSYYIGTVHVAASSTRAAGMLGYHKTGAGVLTISNCLSIVTIDCGGQILTESIKNASPIIGNYSASELVVVSNCFGNMEEYNTNYEVTSYSVSQIASAELAIFGSGKLNFDMTKWQLIPDESDASLYKAPYIQLLFLD